MKIKQIFLLLIFTIFLISSCRRDANIDFESAKDNAAMETEFAQIYDVVSDYVAEDPRTGKTDDYILANGARVIFSDSVFTDGDGIAFVIDYGLLVNGASPKGIPCKDGRYRAGKIHVGMTDHWSHIPCEVTLTISTADGYYVGNGQTMYQLSGLKTITRTSTTTYQVEVSNATMQRDNGTATWNAERAVTLTYDAGPGPWNDEYQITGNANGTNKNGQPFSVETITPLTKKLSVGCGSTFISGLLKLTLNNHKVVDIDYGDGTCDKTVKLTYKGTTRTIQVW